MIFEKIGEYQNITFFNEKFRKIMIHNTIDSYVKESIAPGEVFIDSNTLNYFKSTIEKHGQIVVEPVIISFNDVPLHNDNHPQSENKDVYFIHLVLSGEFILNIGDFSETLKTGDIFLMNPNKSHSVDSTTKHNNSLRVTLCAEIVI